MTDNNPSRSEREAKIKDKAGWVITVLAALLAIDTIMISGNSGKILNNTIVASDIWSFYQAKSIKQTAYELAATQAADAGNKDKAEKYAAKAASYESDPVTGEGKVELMAKARQLEAERAIAKVKAPWFNYSGSLFQIAIVLLTASILAVNMALFWASLVVGLVGCATMLQAMLLILPS
jgi:hypothetical protein